MFQVAGMNEKTGSLAICCSYRYLGATASSDQVEEGCGDPGLPGAVNLQEVIQGNLRSRTLVSCMTETMVKGETEMQEIQL